MICHRQWEKHRKIVADLQHEAVKTSQAGIVDKDYLAMKHQLKKYKNRNNEFREVGKWGSICSSRAFIEINWGEEREYDLARKAKTNFWRKIGKSNLFIFCSNCNGSCMIEQIWPTCSEAWWICGTIRPLVLPAAYQASFIRASNLFLGQAHSRIRNIPKQFALRIIS